MTSAEQRLDGPWGSRTRSGPGRRGPRASMSTSPRESAAPTSNGWVITFVWISGMNPAVSMPELRRIRSILGQDRLFVVVQDLFMT